MKIQILGLIALTLIGCNEADVIGQSVASSATLVSSSSTIVVSSDTCYKEFKADSVVAIGLCAIKDSRLGVQVFDSDSLTSQPKAYTLGTEGYFYRKSVTLKTTWQSVKWTLGEL